MADWVAAHAAHGRETHEAVETGALGLVPLEVGRAWVENDVWVVVEAESWVGEVEPVDGGE
jgi:hypothetical protein